MKQSRPKLTTWLISASAAILSLALLLLIGCNKQTNLAQKPDQSLEQKLKESDNKRKDSENETRIEIKNLENQLLSMKNLISIQQEQSGRMQADISGLKSQTSELQKRLVEADGKTALAQKKTQDATFNGMVENIYIQFSRIMNEPHNFRADGDLESLKRESNRLKSFVNDKIVEIDKLVVDLETQAFPKINELKTIVGNCSSVLKSSLSQEHIYYMQRYNKIFTGMPGVTDQTIDQSMKAYFDLKKQAIEMNNSIRTLKSTN